MPIDLSALELATINAVQGAVVASIRHQCCQWEQESADAVADGRLSNALMLEHLSFAADLLASKVASEFTALFAQALEEGRSVTVCSAWALRVWCLLWQSKFV